jgi:hypothetical protein
MIFSYNSDVLMAAFHVGMLCGLLCGILISFVGMLPLVYKRQELILVLYPMALCASGYSILLSAADMHFSVCLLSWLAFASLIMRFSQTYMPHCCHHAVSTGCMRSLMASACVCVWRNSTCIT